MDGEKREIEKKSNGYTLSFYIGLKKPLDEKSLFGGNVFKNSIYIQQINSRKVVIGKRKSVRDIGRGRFTAAWRKFHFSAVE